MAKAPKSTVTPVKLPLPIPEPALRHHGEALFRAMESWREQLRVPPALLLTGPEGIGKRAIAWYLAQWLGCERNGPAAKAAEADDSQAGLFGGLEVAPVATPVATPARPCGECGSCHRALTGNWVDFTEITADTDDGESGRLKVDHFRKLKETLGFGAYDGAYRVVLIGNAERMTPQAANSMLKIIEEPPRGWIFILTASDATLLLPTLVSRCQRLRLRPFPNPVLRELLLHSGVPRDRLELCAELAQGSWNRGTELAEDEAWEKRTRILRFVAEPHAELNALVDWASSEPANLELLLDLLEQATASLVRLSYESDPAIPAATAADKPLVAQLQWTLKRYGTVERARAFWVARAERLFRARQESLAPLNRKLLIQDVLLPWCENPGLPGGGGGARR